MSKPISNRKKYVILLLSALLLLQNAFAGIQGVWGNIVEINDIGAVSQRSMAGFRVENNSPFKVEYLGAFNSSAKINYVEYPGASNSIVKFNSIPENFSTPDGAEHTFDNRFNNLFMNETDVTSGDVVESDAFFKICPAQYGDKCLYFKLVSRHQDYGYYYAAEAPTKHQLAFDGHIKDLSTGTGLGIGLGASVGALSMGLGVYNLARMQRMKLALDRKIFALEANHLESIHTLDGFRNSQEYTQYKANLDNYVKNLDKYNKLRSDHLKMQKIYEQQISTITRFCEPKKLHEFKLN
jgi:hypothetical protein